MRSDSYNLSHLIVASWERMEAIHSPVNPIKPPLKRTQVGFAIPDIWVKIGSPASMVAGTTPDELSVITVVVCSWFELVLFDPRTASRNLEQAIATRQEHLLDEVESVINTTNRAILPVWRTAPNLTPYKEAGIPTARIALDKIQLRFGQRLRTVDQDHPLTHRVARRPFPRDRGYGGFQPARKRIQRAARLLPRTPRPKILPKRHQPPPATLVDKGSKEETAKTFRAWLETVSDNDLIVYSDESNGPTGAVGWGYVIYRAGRKVAEGKGRLGLAEVFDGEVEGARYGLRRAC